MKLFGRRRGKDESPVPVDGRDQGGRTALHYAAQGNNEAQVRQLLAAGARVNVADRKGWTPLHFAAQAGAVGSARALVGAGAEVDAVDEHGNTPLFTAVYNSDGEGDLILLLRDAGADPLSVNYHGQTPMGLARLIANYDVAQHFADLP